LFGIKGDIYVFAAVDHTSWTLSCNSTGAEGRTIVVKGYDYKTIPLKDLLIADIDYTDEHTIVLKLEFEDEYATPFLELLIYQGQNTYRIIGTPISEGGKGLYLYYYYHPERWTGPYYFK
jgi:hypothetical protein